MSQFPVIFYLDGPTIEASVVVSPPTEILTNTLIGNTPTVFEKELTTTRDNSSFFVSYLEQNGYILGSEFTLKRMGKYPRYECKKCRQLCSRDRKNGVSCEKECAITIDGHNIHEIKKSSHHSQCRVENYGTAIARTAKNEAVVFRSKYGGSSKDVYDTHSKILVAGSSESNVTASDMASGFRTFDRAKSALKKSSKRKSAIASEPINIENEVIERSSTKIMKSIPSEPEDHFLIGQNTAAGVVVLGSRFAVERFFKSKTVMSDGTFKMAPIGFKQAYMLWYIASGQHMDEIVQRSKAIFSACFLLKDKKQSTYEVAFKILDRYRDDHSIPEPHFEEFLTDDEPAVRNAVTALYADTDFSLCLFHHNQNMIKCLIQHKLTCFIRKCTNDEQLWFYGQMKKILMIQLLPLNDMVPAFKMMAEHILKFIHDKLENPFEVQQFNKFFETVEERYFSSNEKLQMVCKYDKQIRTTNPAEARHGVFNNSSLVPKNGTLSNFISAMMVTDAQHRCLAIDFEANGASALPKKRNLYAKQQKVITECTDNIKNQGITIDEFLNRCAEVMVHPKYYKLVEEATKRFEMQKENESSSNSIDDLLNGDDIEEHIEAIFATEDTTNKRVRKLCTKYFGDEWLN